MDTMTTAYLNRIGVEAEPPSTQALARLHRAQVERVAYETFWIHLDEGWTIDPAESLRRIAYERRGGYCFQVNGALALVLRELGYRVGWHVAGVHDDTGANLGNHVALIVEDLPSDPNAGGRWYVDAGLGDVLHEPVPLVSGLYPQGPTLFALAAGGAADWHLSGSFGGVSIVDRAVPLSTFAARHEYNSTSPASSFARTVTAQRRHAGGSSVLRGCVWTRTDQAAVTIESLADWRTLLADEFDVVPDVPSRQLHTLWTSVRRTHETWLATA